MPRSYLAVYDFWANTLLRNADDTQNLDALELVKKKKKRVWLAPYLSLRYKNKWRLEFLMIGEVKARFSKVATLKPGGFF